MIVGTHFLVPMNISAISIIVRIAISKNYLYNGMNDCWNTFSGANEYFCCEYNCKNSHRCISNDYLCDGMNDCRNTLSGASEYFQCKYNCKNSHIYIFLKITSAMACTIVGTPFLVQITISVVSIILRIAINAFLKITSITS